MEEYRIRVRIFVGVVLFVLGVLALRLAHLQIIDQDEFVEVSRGNAIREVRVQPARGAIFDRNGTLMVANQPTYTIMLTPRYFREENVSLLADLLEVSDSLVWDRLRDARRWSPYRPSRSFRDVPFDVYSRIQENIYRLPGVTFDVEEKRRYLTDAVAAHALGYIREISDAELERFNEEVEKKYRQGDLVGKTGVEREYEQYLRGQPGSAFKLVNIHGLEVKDYKDGAENTPPVSGYDVHLALDTRVQALAESLFVGKRGAAVALDPRTGGIIALVSQPDFNPELFARPVDPQTWNYLNNSPQKPLLNRATMNLMPPGSTWKPFMALMSLQEGNVRPGEVVVCRGGHPLGRGRAFTCMAVHGPVDVVSAIKHSCNTFFFEMMYRTDVNTFSRYAHVFGFGEQAPTDLREQTAGLIPDSMYFNRKVGAEVWGPGWTLSLGIGQGDMGVTPLQLARYVAAVANKGRLVTPHVVDYLRHPETGEIVRPDLPEAEQVPIREEYFDLVRKGMRLVMEEGTGIASQIPGIPSGGKTGTAQAPGGMRDHSVFVMFAPWDDPQIALAVQCENAGFGGNCAAPIASLMAELYLKGEIPDTPQKRIRMQRALSARSEPLPNQDSNDSNEIALGG